MSLSRRAFVGLVATALAVKAWLAARLPLFGDEAFYWLESTQPAWAYTDVPGLTPWLVALGTSVFGHTPLGVRAPFLLIGGALPWLIAAWARHFVEPGIARAVGASSLAVPLAGTLGVLALPDVPLTFILLALALVLVRVLDTRRTRDFVLLGALVAMGWLAHYRFIVALVPALTLLALTPRGRVLARDPRLLLVIAIGALGLLPTIAFNAAHDWQGFAFQYVERHPWRLHLAGFAEPLVQALVVTPILAIALLVGGGEAWRRRGDTTAPWDVLAAGAVGLLGAFLLLGLVADAERTRFHWMLPGWLLLLPTLPGVLGRWAAAAGPSRLAARLAWPLGAAGTMALVALLVVATRPPPGAEAHPARPLIDNLAEWPAVVDFARAQRARSPEATLIAGDFMLGAQLEFAFGETVFVLPHPRNVKHGRAGQLAILGRDATAVEAHAWRAGLLLLEDSARREIERLPALLELCERFGRVAWRDELVLRGGRFRVLAFDVAHRVGPSAEDSRACDLPPLGDFDAATPKAVPADRSFTLAGWAIDEFEGAATVEVWLGERVVGRAVPDRPYPGVRGQWPMSTDPRHPDVGFRIELDPLAAGIEPGSYRLQLWVVEASGRARLAAIRGLTLMPPGSGPSGSGAP